MRILCFDPDGEAVKGEIPIERTPSSRVLIEAGNECIYFTAGAQIGKIAVPDMTLAFRSETGHKAEVIDLAVSSLNQMITTSKDGDIRFFNIEDGKQIAEPLEEMDCDHMETYGIHLLTRIGNGEAMLVWRLLSGGGVAETPLGEVELKIDNVPANVDPE